MGMGRNEVVGGRSLSRLLSSEINAASTVLPKVWCPTILSPSTPCPVPLALGQVAAWSHSPAGGCPGCRLTP